MLLNLLYIPVHLLDVSCQESVYFQVNITVLTLKWLQRTALIIKGKTNQWTLCLTRWAWTWARLQCTGWGLLADVGVWGQGRGAQPFCHLINKVGLDLWGIMVMDISDRDTVKILTMQYVTSIQIICFLMYLKGSSKFKHFYLCFLCNTWLQFEHKLLCVRQQLIRYAWL